MRAQHLIGLYKGGRLFRFGGIGNAPMQTLGGPQKKRAGLARSLIAHGDDLVKGLPGKLIPGFAARRAYPDVMLLKCGQRQRMHRARRVAARAHRVQPPLPQMIDEGLGHNRAAGIPGTEDQNFLHNFRD